MWLIVIAVFIGTVIGDSEKLLEERYRLPVYTQLDDYEQCLSKQNGLYCLGTFRIHPNLNTNETYNLIMEYANSKERPNFRSVFHRGYCVSSRCPPHSDPKTRFENCVQSWAADHDLNTTLESLKYCRTQKRAAVFDTKSQAFLLVIFLIVILNFVGTIVNLCTKDKTKSFWNSWSIKENWRQLIAPFGNDPERSGLAPIQIMRVCLMIPVIVIHVVITGREMYMDSPWWYEKWMFSPRQVIYTKMGSVVQVFYMLASFITAYNLLLLSKKQNIGLWMLPKQMLKRYFRLAPVHLLFVIFLGTVWPLISDGPLWTPEDDSSHCRKNLWFHVLYINNMFWNEGFCLEQAGSLAVDIQLQLVTLFITISLVRCRLPKLTILAMLFVLSITLNFCLAYAKNIKTFFRIIKDFKETFSTDSYASLTYYYLPPWGSLPACIMGQFLAHIYFQCRQEDFKVYEHKWLRYLCRYSFLLFPLWMWGGIVVYDWKNPLLLALHLSIERPAFCLPFAIWLFGIMSGVRIYPGFKALSHRVWIVLGRLTFSVLIIHWTIITTRFLSSPDPIVISSYILLKESIVTLILSYTLAVPISLLIELPTQNTYNYLSKLSFKIITDKIEAKEISPKKVE